MTETECKCISLTLTINGETYSYRFTPCQWTDMVEKDGLLQHWANAATSVLRGFNSKEETNND